MNETTKPCFWSAALEGNTPETECPTAWEVASFKKDTGRMKQVPAARTLPGVPAGAPVTPGAACAQHSLTGHKTKHQVQNHCNPEWDNRPSGVFPWGGPQTLCGQQGGSSLGCLS